MLRAHRLRRIDLGRLAIHAMPLLPCCFSNILFYSAYSAKVILPTERGRTPRIPLRTLRLKKEHLTAKGRKYNFRPFMV